MSISSRSLLLRAIELLKTKGWTRNNMAKNKRGRCVGPTDIDAACFCAVGALRRAAHDSGIEVDDITYKRARTALDRLSQGGSVITFNDFYAKSKEDVILKFMEASSHV